VVRIWQVPSQKQLPNSCQDIVCGNGLTHNATGRVPVAGRVDLPRDTSAFDFNTITDVVLHLKHTARDGGDILKKAAKKAPKGTFVDDQATQVTRLFSLEHEFLTDRYCFPCPGDQTAASQTLTRLHALPVF
jgi:hypothetical protein